MVLNGLNTTIKTDMLAKNSQQPVRSNNEQRSESSFSETFNKANDDKNYQSKSKHEPQSVERKEDKPVTSSRRDERSRSTEEPQDKKLFLPNNKVVKRTPTNHSSVDAENTLDNFNKNLDNDFSTLNDKIEKLGFTKEEVVDPLTRRAAIQKFMKKMNEEFGVSPVDILNSFRQLSTEELGLPAEQTISKVISHLELPPMQSMRAETYFNKMIQESSTHSMAEYLKGEGDRQISLEVLSKKQLKQNNIDAKVDDLQNSFFKPAVATAATASSTTLQGNKQASELQSMNTGFQSADAVNIEDLATEAEIQSMSVEQPAQAKPAVKSFDDLMGQLSLKMNELKNTVQPKSQQLTEASLEEAGIDAASVNVNKVTAEAGIQTAMNNESGDENSLEDMDFNNAEVEGFQLNTEKTTDKNTSLKTVMVNNKPVMVTEADEAQNNREVIQTANRLLKNGGGEMKVKLNPEGLGEIGLKVAVEKGQVTVEMVTENNHLKKLVERGLGDLKATLSSHNLDVSQIKVDTSQDLSQQLNQQQQDAERQMAQQFLQDFRRQNQEFREFMTGGNVGIPESQTSGEPSDQAQQLLEKQRAKASNRRLDLVA